MNNHPAPDELAIRIRNGENGRLLEQLVRLCRPYCRRLANVCGFGILTTLDSFDELVQETVDEAVAKWRPDGPKPYAFILAVRSAMLHVCRSKMRELIKWPFESLDRRLEEFGREPTAEIFSPPPPDGEAYDNIYKNELNECLQEAVAREDNQSRTVVTEWNLGNPHKQIAEKLGVKEGRSPEIVSKNCRGIRDYVQAQYPDLFK